MRLYALYDTQAGTLFANPFLAHMDTEAIRVFTDVLHDTNSFPAKHPEDFDLLCLGNINHETGLIDAAIPTAIITGRQLTQNTEIQQAKPTRDLFTPSGA